MRYIGCFSFRLGIDTETSSEVLITSAVILLENETSFHTPNQRGPQLSYPVIPSIPLISFSEFVAILLK